MKKVIPESAVIISYIDEVASANGQDISSRQLTDFMKQLGMNKGLIDYELIVLEEQGLIKAQKSGKNTRYKLTRKGLKLSKNIIVVN